MFRSTVLTETMKTGVNFTARLEKDIFLLEKGLGFVGIESWQFFCQLGSNQVDVPLDHKLFSHGGGKS